MPRSTTLLGHLRLLQLADSALPVGTVAHSFGLETLAAEQILVPDALEAFLRDYLLEAGTLDGAFCRAAHRLRTDCPDFERDWLSLAHQLSARKPARESRAASATLGRRLLQLVTRLEPAPLLERAWSASKGAGADVHYSAAFGLAGAALALDEELTVLSFLQQFLTGAVSACQRLMPLGQTQASVLLWELKPFLIEATERGRDRAFDAVPCFTPLLDAASMRHPTLAVRLFVS